MPEDREVQLEAKGDRGGRSTAERNPGNTPALDSCTGESRPQTRGKPTAVGALVNGTAASDGAAGGGSAPISDPVALWTAHAHSDASSATQQALRVISAREPALLNACKTASCALLDGGLVGYWQRNWRQRISWQDREATARWLRDESDRRRGKRAEAMRHAADYLDFIVRGHEQPMSVQDALSVAHCYGRHESLQLERALVALAKAVRG
jgi:hypothetical protein